MNVALLCALLATDAGVALPGPPACTLRTKNHHYPTTLELRPGVPYARVEGYGLELEVALPASREVERAGVSLKIGGVRLTGLVPPSGFPLHAGRPFLVGELFVPGTGTPLRLTEVGANGVGVELALSERLKRVVRAPKGPPRATRPCADLRVDMWSQFDQYDAVGGRGRDVAMVLRAGAPVALSALPEGPTLAELAVDPNRPEQAQVRVIEQRAGWSRIGWWSGNDDKLGDGVLVVAWVPDARLAKPTKPHKPDPGVFGIFRPPGDPAPGAPFVCDKDLSLIAEVGADRRVVGTVSPGVYLRTRRIDDAFVGVQLVLAPKQSVTPMAGARFLVRRADIAGCRGFIN